MTEPNLAELPKLPLLCDVVFRRLFDEPPYLVSLLNGILGLKGEEQISSLTISNPQIAGPIADDKEVILDVRTVCQSGRCFHVEVQVRAFTAYPERMLYYWAGPYQGQLRSGQGYQDLQPVISIHILGFHLLPQTPRFRDFHHIFEVLERRTHHRLSDHLQLHTIELPKFLASVGQRSTAEKKWLYFLRHGHELTSPQVAALGLPELVAAEEKLRVISQDRILRDLYESRMKAQRDAIAWEKDKIAEWLAQGEKRGIDKGKRLGIDEGKKLGIDEGKRLAILDMCALLDINVTARRQAQLKSMDTAALEALREQIRTSRAWPKR